jgi:hypothetical protein
MKFLIAILILALVLVAGCTQISSFACSPNWIKTIPISESVAKMYGFTADEMCKTTCYNSYEVTSHSLGEPNSKGGTIIGNGPLSCYCDVNNCNP